MYISQLFLLEEGKENDDSIDTKIKEYQIIVYCKKLLINNINIGNLLFVFVTILVFCSLSKYIIQSINDYFIKKIEIDFEIYLQDELLKIIIHQPISFWQETNPTILYNLVNTTIDDIVILFSSIYIKLLNKLMILLIILIRIIIYTINDPKMGLLIIMLLLIIALINFLLYHLYYKKIEKKYYYKEELLEENKKQKAIFNTQIFENNVLLTIYSKNSQIGLEYNKLLQQLKKKEKEVKKLEIINESRYEITPIIQNFMIYIACTIAKIQKFVSISFFYIIFEIIYTSLREITAVAQILQTKNNKEKTINKFFSLFELKQDKKDAKKDTFIEQIDNFTIETEEFYEIKSGVSYTISGVTGVGKTTLFNSIAKLNNYSNYNVKINNLSIQNINYESYLFYAPQSAMLFDKSIKENILYYTPFNEKIFNEVVKICDLYFMINKEGEFDYQFIKNEISLSGGEQSRICLARTIYAFLYSIKILQLKYAILLCDEPYASLDFMTSFQIEKNISDMINELNKLGVNIYRLTIDHTSTSKRESEIILKNPIKIESNTEK